MCQMIWPDEHIEDKIDFEDGDKLMLFDIVLLEFELKLLLVSVEVSFPVLTWNVELIQGV